LAIKRYFLGAAFKILMMNLTNYQPPVDRLLTFGDCRQKMNEWPNYVAELGLGKEQIPDLIAMAVDNNLTMPGSESLENWAPVHAWRALGQLGAEAAIEPLMVLFGQLEDSDWLLEEMPKVYGMIGATAIPGLGNYLKDDSHGLFPRITAITSLEEVAKQHPEMREKCIIVLTQQLKLFNQTHPELNGFIVASLIQLAAVESASVIKCAFEANQVADDITGTWEDVRNSLGIPSDRDIPDILDVISEELQIEDIAVSDEVGNLENVISSTLLADSEESASDEVGKIDKVIPDKLSSVEDGISPGEEQNEAIASEKVINLEDIASNQVIPPQDEISPEKEKIADAAKTIPKQTSKGFGRIIHSEDKLKAIKKKKK
jgi:hypothetical protein